MAGGAPERTQPNLRMLVPSPAAPGPPEGGNVSGGAGYPKKDQMRGGVRCARYPRPVDRRCTAAVRHSPPAPAEAEGEMSERGNTAVGPFSGACSGHGRPGSGGPAATGVRIPAPMSEVPRTPAANHPPQPARRDLPAGGFGGARLPQLGWGEVPEQAGSGTAPRGRRGSVLGTPPAPPSDPRQPGEGARRSPPLLPVAAFTGKAGGCRFPSLAALRPEVGRMEVQVGPVEVQQLCGPRIFPQGP